MQVAGLFYPDIWSILPIGRKGASTIMTVNLSDLRCSRHLTPAHEHQGLLFTRTRLN